MGSSVSVVVTCHNYGRYLRECLESILAQERRAEEILVVDDASTDETPAIAAEYAEQGVRYERVEYRDACRSYNHGMAASTGDLIAYVDADNALTPRFIGTLAARLEAEPTLAFAYSDRYWSGEASVAAWAEISATPGRIARSYPPDPAMLVHQNFIDTTAMVRREIAVAVGGFRTLPALWDYRFWLTLLESGYSGGHIPEPLYYYRLHASNMILSTRPQHRGLRLLIRREHFAQPFWQPYVRPELALECAVVPGRVLPGGTVCTLFVTPRVLGAAYPAAVRLVVALPPGVECLAATCERDGGRITTGGGVITAELPYPVPDRAAAALPPILCMTVVVRASHDGQAIAASLEWEDIFESRHEAVARIALPSLAVRPPFALPVASGALQVIREQFGPVEAISVWAAMPPGAPHASVPLPPAEAEADGTVRIDLRAAPERFAAIVVQGELLGNQVVLLPAVAPPARAVGGVRVGGRRAKLTALRRVLRGGRA